MSPVAMREHPTIAGNPASKEIRNPLAAEATVEEEAMPTAVAEAAEEEIEVAVAEEEIEAAAKRAGETPPRANENDYSKS